MKIHEYQAKELLRRFDVPLLKGVPVFSPEEAGKITYEEFQSKGIGTVVLKAQVHAGGRGKGIVYDIKNNTPMKIFEKQVRGVNIISKENIADKVYNYAKAMLGNKLVTIQTGEAGTIINRLFIEQGTEIEKEYYTSIVLDRQVGKNLIMVSTEGGMEIEKVAADTPEKILKEHIDPALGLQAFQTRRLGFGLGLKGDALKSFTKFIPKLVKAYIELDCSMLEINPLVLTKAGEFIALDAKINFDDSALFRHQEYADLRDITEEDALEVEASKYDLNYIKLDGNVGCMVNGAGLAMSTMDLIKLSGGNPANFLDVGGGANPNRIANAFRIMLSDPNVKAVLINIFGGIVRCDKVADGIVQALQTVKVDVPVIIRLDGTKAKEGKKTLKQSGMKFEIAENFEDAAKLITKVVSKAS
ncbi:MAG TPA: ADP-forming succinate--CoA ligase subunit beta [Candidatus Kapabacteria bacterium]|nr:ADP-forming succinate--CoA ligase subunit beta [Candidatus Kapabacteria bacterium]HPO62117.1 ADP-forming succinate--CoA ligase subunit beta [Candidatus Kapabacteria bacterium]